MKAHKYSKEEDDFIKNNYKGITVKKLTELYNEKFNLNVSVDSIRQYKIRHGYKWGVNKNFQKGDIPTTKGLKQTDYMTAEALEKSKATRFKKGNIPHNHKPVGSMRFTVDGYKEIKTAEPSEWKLYGRYVWEQANGEIPKGCVLLHKNGNRSDDSLENLILLTKREVALLNTKGLFGKNNELNEIAINIAKLDAKISEVKNDCRGKKKSC